MRLCEGNQFTPPSLCLSFQPPPCLVNLFDTCELNTSSVTTPPPPLRRQSEVEGGAREEEALFWSSETNHSPNMQSAGRKKSPALKRKYM